MPPADTITHFLQKRFRPTTASGTLGPDDPLFSSGIVDSFGVLELIAFLEDSFAVTIDPARHELTEFDTVRRIVALVDSIRQP